jgi:hypothetical protein
VANGIGRIQQQLLAAEEFALRHVDFVGGCAPQLQRIAPQHHERLRLAAQARGQLRARRYAGGRLHGFDMGRAQKKARKQFFSEEKNQKTFDYVEPVGA